MAQLLTATGIKKAYGDCISLGGVDFELATGEIHALVGENGAGKSTLLKILYRLERQDAGEVRFDGAPLAPRVAAAQTAGLRMVQQHFALVDEMTVVESVLVTQPDTPRLFDLGGARARVTELAQRYELGLDPDRRIADLSVGERQRVELLRVLWRPCRVLLLDEPTAVLGPREVDALLALLRRLREEAVAIVIVTHKLGEVRAIADRVTVLRRGMVSGTFGRGATIDEMARAVVGGEPPAALAPAPAATGEPRLEVRQLTIDRADGVRALDNVELTVRAGEVLGLGGVEGNGQSELLRFLAGLEPRQHGTLLLDGRTQATDDVASRRRAGIAHVPEDRHRYALLAEQSLAANVYLEHTAELTRHGLVDREALVRKTTDILRRFDVRPADPEARAGGLSGGNQQKLVVGRALDAAPGNTLTVALFGQPSRGVDLGATRRLHDEIARLREAGCAVVVLSADLDELLALSQRIAIFYRGKIVKLLDNPPDGDRAALRDQIGAAMIGAAP